MNDSTRTKGKGSEATQFKPVHGMSSEKQGKRDPTYTVWRTMRQRCLYKKHKSFDRYGGRGIRICKEWDSFELFFADMGAKPKGMTLGRIDNEGDYCKQNCRWETPLEQANNKSSNVFITFGGQTKTIAEWARSQNIRSDTLRFRLKSGWDIEKALTTIPKSCSQASQKNQRQGAGDVARFPRA